MDHANNANASQGCRVGSGIEQHYKIIKPYETILEAVFERELNALLHDHSECRHLFWEVSVLCSRTSRQPVASAEGGVQADTS